MRTKIKIPNMLWSPIKDASVSIQENHNKFDPHSEALLIHRQTWESATQCLQLVYDCSSNLGIEGWLYWKFILPCNAVTLTCCNGKKPAVCPHSVFMYFSDPQSAGHSGRAVWGVGLQSLACWDWRVESHRGHACLSVVSVVCCQVEVSATSWSLVQRSPTDCGVSLFVYYLKSSKTGRPWPSLGSSATGDKKILRINADYFPARYEPKSYILVLRR